MPDELSVPEVAEALAVSRARVHQLIAQGALPARKFAGRWMVDRVGVIERRHENRPWGRPLSPRMAWGLLTLASGLAPGWLGATELSRLRHRLRALPIDSWPWMCRNRARRHRFYAHPAALARVLEDPACVRSGISAAADYEVDLVSIGDAEVYLRADDLAKLEHRYALAEGQQNLAVRVPREIWPFSDAQTAAHPAVVAVDLMEAGDDRSVRAGQALLRSELGKAHLQQERSGHS